MKLSAPSGTRLVGASTPAAGVAEVHEMKMEGDTMRMRAAGTLDLPARQTVELKPGGYHLMLMDLKKALTKDSTVPLTLHFEDANGRKSSKELDVPVLAGAAAPAGSEHKHSGPKAALLGVSCPNKNHLRRPPMSDKSKPFAFSQFVPGFDFLQNLASGGAWRCERRARHAEPVKLGRARH